MPTRGMFSPVCISSSTFKSLLPRLPPGCGSAKSSSLKPLFSRRATARASPMDSAAAVDAVGARPRGHASSFTPISMITSPAYACYNNLAGCIQYQVNGPGEICIEPFGKAGYGPGLDLQDSFGG